MKFSKITAGFVAILVLFALAVSISYTGLSHQKFKTEQTSNINAKGLSAVNVIIAEAFSKEFASIYNSKVSPVANVPNSSDYRMYERIGYRLPVNDDKPDNTNYQLIRFEQLPVTKINYKS